MSAMDEHDDVSGVETTGHEWDGIRELNNPLPRWWLWTFYACIVFAVIYCIAYPAWPGLSGASKGLLGWSSRADIREEMIGVAKANAGLVQKIEQSSIDEILASESMRTFAVSAGSSLFKTRCTTCHGSGAQGGPGFPNLNDNSWLWGGKPEDIRLTIMHGIRDMSDGETRTSQMPTFGENDLLEKEKFAPIAQYVLKLSGQVADEKLAEVGKPLFGENCASCHSDYGQGKAEFGAPQLNDAIWLYAGDVNGITKQMHNPHHGSMPAWGSKLGDVAVKQLAAYVHSLGGGE